MTERDALQEIIRRLDDHGELLKGIRERLEALEVLPGAVDALRADVDTLGHRTRRGWDELLTDMPPAVVAAVDRSFGAELRSLRADVEALQAGR